MDERLDRFVLVRGKPREGEGGRNSAHRRQKTTRGLGM